MKTALDLPDELAREIKVRAAMQGRKLKDVIAELLRLGLDAPTTEVDRPSPLAVVDHISGLPTIICRIIPPSGGSLTPERVAAILLEQEV